MLSMSIVAIHDLPRGKTREKKGETSTPGLCMSLFGVFFLTHKAWRSFLHTLWFTRLGQLFGG